MLVAKVVVFVQLRILKYIINFITGKQSSRKREISDAETSGMWPVNTYTYLYVSLCVGGSKGKAGIDLKYYPENRDTFEIYPGKVMRIIALIQSYCYSNPQCNVTVIREVSYTKCYLNTVGECKHSTP